MTEVIIAMCKCFIPYAHAKSLGDINPNFFVSQGVKTLLVDLDNTLDSYKLYTPTDHALEVIKRIQASGIKLVIISNNRGKRVSTYANAVGVEYISSAKKPFPGAIKRYVKNNGLSREDVMFVGDQMMTDVLAAHNAHVRMVLTEKIVKEDQFTTHINRIFDRPIRKHHMKKGHIPEWSDLYGKSTKS